MDQREEQSSKLVNPPPTHTQTTEGSFDVCEGTTKLDFFELNNLQHFTIKENKKLAYTGVTCRAQGAPAHYPYFLSCTHPNSDFAGFMCSK